MDFNIEDIFDDTDDIESIIDVETVFANIIKCVLVGNKIEKIIKKNKIAIVNIINKNKPKKKVDEQEQKHEIDEKEEENEPNNDTRIIIDEKKEEENENEKEEENEQKENDKILNEEFEDVGNIEDKVINKYYKIIALKCHPDKCKNEKFNKYFILAQEAYKKKDMLILLFIYAKTINDYKCVTKDELSYFSTIVDDLDKDQQNKCSSILYQWDRLTEDEKNMYIDDVKRKNNL